MWFNLTGDSRLGRCDTEGCGGQPTWRLEADDGGSNYCSGCKERIDANTLGMTSEEWRREKAMAEWMNETSPFPKGES